MWQSTIYYVWKDFCLKALTLMLWEKLVYLNICAWCHFRSLQCVKYPCGILLVWEVKCQWNTLCYLKCHQSHVMDPLHTLQDLGTGYSRWPTTNYCLPSLNVHVVCFPICEVLLQLERFLSISLAFFCPFEKVEYAVVDTVCTVALSHTKIVL